MRQSKAKGLTDHLRGGCRTEKLTSPARCGARAAAHFGRIVACDFSVGEPGADRLDLTRVFALFGRQGDPARHQYGR